ncbi:hypothetical protein D3C85_1838620 [compost metagenome]
MEWVVFAGFSIFIWWRLVKDDYRRDLEEDEDEDDDFDETGHPEAATEPTSPEPEQKVQQ